MLLECCYLDSYVGKETNVVVSIVVVTFHFIDDISEEDDYEVEPLTDSDSIEEVTDEYDETK